MTEKTFRKDDDDYEQQRNEMGVGGGVFGTGGVLIGEARNTEDNGLQDQRDETRRQRGKYHHEPADFAQHEPGAEGAERKDEQHHDAAADSGTDGAESPGGRTGTGAQETGCDLRADAPGSGR
jgi:hypothetical protein